MIATMPPVQGNSPDSTRRMGIATCNIRRVYIHKVRQVARDPQGIAAFPSRVPHRD